MVLSRRRILAVPRDLALIVALGLAAVWVVVPQAVSTTVVISEFRVRGPNGGNDEFVELYNLSSSPVAIGGWKIVGSNSSGTTSVRATITAGTTLDPGCHYLLTNSAASGYSGSTPGNQTYGTGITDDGGIAVTLANDTIVDQVGMSSGSLFKEATPLASLGTSNLNRGYERKPGGSAGSGTDTDSNVADFQQVTPSDPQNLGSTCGATPPTEPPTAPFVMIHEIQGASGLSPFAGQAVSTEGIVTARRFNNGFFLQTPDANVDTSEATSEGVFVFTSTAPPAGAVVGALVRVTGTVAEFVPPSDPASPPMTELTAPTVTVLSTGNALPAAIALGPASTSPTGPVDALERFEGMRVHIDTLDVIAPTSGSLQEANATATSNGVFYGVIHGIARPFREPGVSVIEPLPPAPPGVPRFDTNPERLRVDSDGQVGASRLEVTSGALVTNLTGVLDFGFRTYSVLPDPAPVPTVTGNRPSFSAVRLPASDEFTVASANVERFFDTTDGPGSDVVLTPAALAMRLQKLSLQIRHVMRSPDILGVEEVENLPVLQAIAARVNDDTVFGGGTNPGYVAYLEEGNDPGGIDVGFLVKSSRVNVLEATQFGKDTRFVDPRDGSLDILNDRPPLLLRAEMLSSTHGALPVTVIVNHLRSLDGVNDPADVSGSAWIRLKRRTQAEFLASLIQSRQSGGERVISVGDYNAFEFSDGLVDVMGTVAGAPAPITEVVLPSLDLVDPNLVQLSSTALSGERYSYVFDGNAQLLDHVLISANLTPLVTGIAWGRSNSDFPESLRGDATRPERLSDHDPVVAYFRFPDQLPPTIAQLAATPNAIWPVNHKMVSVALSVAATDAVDTAPVCTLVRVASNEDDDGPGDGRTSGDAVITGPLTADVRAERRGGGAGRVYTFTVSCADTSGNALTATTEVRVAR